MPSDKLNWGLLSTAGINRRLIPAIRDADRGELLAVASRDQARAESYAAEWGIPRAHGSYQALLDDPDIDAVYVSLPNSLHADWTVRAAGAGKHVLCEKPLALSTVECDEIITAAAAAGVVVTEAVMYLHHPLLQRARQLVQGGALGEIRLARSAFSFPLNRPDDVRWKPELGGGSLWDLGSYPVSFIRWMCGEPERVFGRQTLAEGGVDASFAGLLQYESGVLALFDCGFSYPFRAEAEVVGSEAVLRLERPYLMTPESRIVIRREDDSEEVITLPAKDPYLCEVEALTAAVLDGAPMPVSLANSRANVATLAALYESAREGGPRPVSSD
jgi:predicted dehydrogenase